MAEVEIKRRDKTTEGNERYGRRREKERKREGGECEAVSVYPTLRFPDSGNRRISSRTDTESTDVVA